MPYATLDQIAHLLKLTPRTVNLHAKEDGLPRISRGQYDMVACVHWYVGYLQKRIKDARRGDETEQQARARLTRTTADIRELELGKARAELIEVAQAKAVWERLVVAFKTKMLAIPSKLPQRLVACSDINQIKDLLEREIVEALSELSRTDIEVSDIPKPARDHPVVGKTRKSTSKTQGKRVGRQVQSSKSRVKRRTGPVEDGQG
jgi:phage terminase Nu1 subunit (DNA packaging protein)